MHEKGLGTPATRAAIIEGLLGEKYMLREGRELIPTAKAFQLMTLLRGLGVEELSKPELTGEWEYKLSEMEHGRLSRAEFMREIAAMTEHIVKKAKEYDRDTVPGDYATLTTPCPNCGGVVKENYRRYACTGKQGERRGLRLLLYQDPRPAAPSSWPRWRPSCATRRSARWRASAPRPAGPSRPRSRSSTTRKRRTGSSSSTSARTTSPKPASWSTSPARNPWAPAPNAVARCTNTARTTSARRPSPPWRSPPRVATSRAARSSCSNPSNARRWPSC